MAEEIKAGNTDNIDDINDVDSSDSAEKTNKADKTDKKTAKVKSGNKPVKEKVGLGAKFKKFIKDYRSEMKKIVWPTRDQVIKNTGVVLVAIVFMAIVVGLLDLLFGGFGLQGLGSLKELISK